MRKWLLVVVLLVVPAGLWGQGVEEGVPVRRTPLELLLEHGERLQLTEAQVARLVEVRERLARRNEPLIGRIMLVRAQWQQEQGGAAAVRRDPVREQRMRHAVQRAHEQIQANNRAAMQEVHRVLQPEQRHLLREIVQSNRLRRPGMRPDTGGVPHARRGGGF